jgi:hypothetical protein
VAIEFGKKEVTMKTGSKNGRGKLAAGKLQTNKAMRALQAKWAEEDAMKAAGYKLVASDEDMSHALWFQADGGLLYVHDGKRTAVDVDGALSALKVILQTDQPDSDGSSFWDRENLGKLLDMAKHEHPKAEPVEIAEGNDSGRVLAFGDGQAFLGSANKYVPISLAKSVVIFRDLQLESGYGTGDDGSVSDWLDTVAAAVARAECGI